MKSLLTLTSALLLSATPALASVTVDLDKKLVTYNNDNDGMQYTVTAGQRQSVGWDDIRRAPLNAQGAVRYSVNQQTKQLIPTSQPGPLGLRFSRPLADAEAAEVTQASIAVQQSIGSGALVLDPNADPGPVMTSFDALAGDVACKVVLYEKAADVCGQKFGRNGVVNWTMFPDNYCSAYGFCYRENYEFTIGYQSREGRKAASFRFVNGKAAKKFIQVFSAWGGSTPQRI